MIQSEIGQKGFGNLKSMGFFLTQPEITTSRTEEGFAHTKNLQFKKNEKLKFGLL